MKLIDNFNIYLKGKAVEELEKATNVRRLCWGILAVIALYAVPPILQSLSLLVAN